MKASWCSDILITLASKMKTPVCFITTPGGCCLLEYVKLCLILFTKWTVKLEFTP